MPLCAVFSPSPIGFNCSTCLAAAPPRRRVADHYYYYYYYSWSGPRALLLRLQPWAALFSADLLQSLGFNVVRLGWMWSGLMPEADTFNQSYVNQTRAIVKKLAERGIYTLLDMHQVSVSDCLLQHETCTHAELHVGIFSQRVAAFACGS